MIYIYTETLYRVYIPLFLAMCGGFIEDRRNMGINGTMMGMSWDRGFIKDLPSIEDFCGRI